jgi:hypothetical protein
MPQETATGEGRRAFCVLPQCSARAPNISHWWHASASPHIVLDVAATSVLVGADVRWMTSAALLLALFALLAPPHTYRAAPAAALC